MARGPFDRRCADSRLMSKTWCKDTEDQVWIPGSPCRTVLHPVSHITSVLWIHLGNSDEVLLSTPLKNWELFFVFPFPDANWNRSKCEPGTILLGGHLRSWEDHHLQLLEGFHTVQSCQTACCQSPTCDAFWFLENMCIQVNCTLPTMCQANRTGSSDSILVFLKKSKSTEHLKLQTGSNTKTWLRRWLHWGVPVPGKKRLRRSFQKWSLANNGVELLQGDVAASPSDEAAARASDSKPRKSRSETERLKDQVLRRLVEDRPGPETHPKQRKDSLKHGQEPDDEKTKSPFPPKSDIVNGSSDADSVGFPQVRGISGTAVTLQLLLYADLDWKLFKYRITFWMSVLNLLALSQQSKGRCFLFCWGWVYFPPSYLG